MEPEHVEDRFLTIGEVTRLWRVSADSLRSWSDQGVLHPVLTPGGQRRFRQREVAAVLGKLPAAAPGGPPGKSRRGGARTPMKPGHVRGFSFHPGLRMDQGTGSPEVDMAREELEITRARRETDALAREMEQERLEASTRAEAERAHREVEQRLEDLRAYGRSRAAALPIEWRQRVISMLEAFVNIGNVPPSLPELEARALVAAKVQQIQEQYDAQQARELSEAVGRWQVQGLIERGCHTAALLTTAWDSQDAEEAKTEVARELAGCVEPDWTEADVRRRVEEILDDWEGEDEEGEAGEEDGNDDEAIW